MSIIRDVISAVADGTFFMKLRNRIRRKRKIFIVKNERIRELIYQENAYIRLKEQYMNILEQEYSVDRVQKKSNKIWICWLQGIESAPDIVKACIASIKTAYPEKEIIILTNENIPQYVELPSYVIELWKSGKMNSAHYADILRLELLCKHGGAWMDATLLCTDKLPERLLDMPLFVFKLMDLSREKQNMVASNWFLSSYTNQSILLKTRDLLYAYWKDYNYAIDYYVFHLFFTMATEKYAEEWKAVPFYNNHSPHTLQFELFDEYSETRWNQIKGMSAIHKLNHHNDYTKCESTFYNYIVEKYWRENE